MIINCNMFHHQRTWLYFFFQVINNACATQAVISLLLNCDHPDVDLGPELTKLKEFSMSFDPKMRGLTLSNSQTIRSAHNSMSNQTLFEFDQKMPAKVSLISLFCCSTDNFVVFISIVDYLLLDNMLLGFVFGISRTLNIKRKLLLALVYFIVLQG